MKVVRPLSAIKMKCYECSGFSLTEGKLCPHKDCVLWPLRFGRKPKGAKYSKITLEAYRIRIEEG